MSKKQDIAALKAKAAKCRATARQSDDMDEAHRTFKLAAKLEKQARDMEQDE
jgi:hypothetical protein